MRKMVALTRRQRQVYDFVCDFIATQGYSPSFEEIGAAMQLRSLASVSKHVHNLVKKGLLFHQFNRSRSITLNLKPPALGPRPDGPCQMCGVNKPNVQGLANALANLRHDVVMLCQENGLPVPLSALESVTP